MDREVSFMGANLYAQQVGWDCTVEDWGRGDRTTRAWFEPEDTCAGRYEALFADIAARGFRMVDIWTTQYSPEWASETHASAIEQSLARHGLRVASIAGGPFGDTPETFAAHCEVAARLGAPLLGGYSALFRADRETALDILARHDVVFAWENHPEPDAPAMLEHIGELTAHHGACVDTGWFETQGMAAGAAIRALGEAVRYVHLKDVREAGAHRSCALGDGVLDLDDTLTALDDIGYDGPLSIEHEADGYDPRPEVELSRDRVRAWSRNR